MKKILKAGVVGLGFGETHVQSLHNNHNCKLIKVCDLNKNKKDFFKKKYHVNFTTSFHELVNDPNINLITIASYDNYHFKMILSSLKNNKHVFVEKPLCQTENQAKQIKRLLLKKKLKLSTNMVLRCHPKFLKIFNIIQSGKIGKIYHLEGEYNYGRFNKLTNSWRGEIPYYSVTQGGGIHILDLFTWITGARVKAVTAISNNLRSKNTKFKFPDTVTALLKFNNGITGKLTSNFSIKTPHHHVLNIHGDKGSIFCGHEGIYLYTSNYKKYTSQKITYKKKLNYKLGIIKNFVDHISKKKKLMFSFEDTFHNMSIVFAIDKSLKTKKWEKVKN